MCSPRESTLSPVRQALDPRRLLVLKPPPPSRPSSFPLPEALRRLNGPGLGRQRGYVRSFIDEYSPLKQENMKGLYPAFYDDGFWPFHDPMCSRKLAIAFGSEYGLEADEDEGRDPRQQRSYCMAMATDKV